MNFTVIAINETKGQLVEQTRDKNNHDGPCDIAFNALRVSKQQIADVQITAYERLNVSDFNLSTGWI